MLVLPQCCDEDGNPDEDMFEMAVFAWKEDYKSMKLRMDKYRDNESNATWPNHVDKRYARNEDESNQVSTR